MRLYGVLLEQYVGAQNTDFGFAGEQADANGLYNLRARYYDPTLGSFLSRDPVMGAVGGPNVRFNPYLYAGGNPVNFVDPSGRIFWLAFLAAVAKGIFWGAVTGAALSGGITALSGGSFEDVVNAALEGAITGGIGGGIGGAFGAVAARAGTFVRNVERLGRLAKPLSRLTQAGIGAAGFATDVGAGVLWDRAVHGDTPSDAFGRNLAGGILGELIGFGIGLGARLPFSKQLGSSRIGRGVLAGINRINRGIDELVDQLRPATHTDFRTFRAQYGDAIRAEVRYLNATTEISQRELDQIILAKYFHQRITQKHPRLGWRSTTIAVGRPRQGRLVASMYYNYDAGVGISLRAITGSDTGNVIIKVEGVGTVDVWDVRRIANRGEHAEEILLNHLPDLRDIAVSQQPCGPRHRNCMAMLTEATDVRTWWSDFRDFED